MLEAAEQFEKLVLEPAWHEYERGRTPNPCVRCNELVKFAALFDLAHKLGARFVATGHHARLAAAPDGTIRLLRGADRNKDQTYFLYRLLPLLDRLVFPIGDMTKAQVRAKAEDLGLAVADRPDSQDACLVKSGSGRTDFAEALRERFGGKAKPGFILDASGQVLGRHQGYHRFTIGQRRGIGVASARGRLYVTELHAERAEVIVGPGEGLLSMGLVASDLVWAAAPRKGRYQVQIRYRHKAVPAAVLPLPGSNRDEDRVLVRFDSPQRAVTPGQAVVFYDGETGDQLLGGGWIDQALRDGDPVLESMDQTTPPEPPREVSR